MKKKTKVENMESAEAVAPKAADYVRKRIELRRRAQCYWSSWTMCVAHEPDKLR